MIFINFATNPKVYEKLMNGSDNFKTNCGIRFIFLEVDNGKIKNA